MLKINVTCPMLHSLIYQGVKTAALNSTLTKSISIIDEQHLSTYFEETNLSDLGPIILLTHKGSVAQNLLVNTPIVTIEIPKPQNLSIEFYTRSFTNKLIETINKLKSEKSKGLTVYHKGAALFLNLGDIFYLKAMGQYTQIHLNNVHYLYPKPMCAVIDNYCNNGFLRVHRSYAVNLDFILGVHNSKNLTFIKLLNGTEVPVSTRRKAILDSIDIKLLRSA